MLNKNVRGISELNMGYFGERNYINEASSLLLDLCCLSLYTCEIKLLLLLCTYSQIHSL